MLISSKNVIRNTQIADEHCALAHEGNESTNKATAWVAGAACMKAGRAAGEACGPGNGLGRRVSSPSVLAEMRLRASMK
jgi:hypothetical protein